MEEGFCDRFNLMESDVLDTKSESSAEAITLMFELWTSRPLLASNITGMHYVMCATIGMSLWNQCVAEGYTMRVTQGVMLYSMKSELASPFTPQRV